MDAAGVSSSLDNPQIDPEITAWKDRHTTDDGGKIPSGQGRDNVTPVRPREFNLYANIRGDFIRDIVLCRQ